MVDHVFTVGATLKVVKHEGCTLSDMELAAAVLAELKERLGPPNTALRFSFVNEATHAFMVGPEGGTPIETP